LNDLELKTNEFEKEEKLEFIEFNEKIKKYFKMGKYNKKYLFTFAILFLIIICFRQ